MLNRQALSPCNECLLEKLTHWDEGWQRCTTLALIGRQAIDDLVDGKGVAISGERQLFGHSRLDRSFEELCNLERRESWHSKYRQRRDRLQLTFASSRRESRRVRGRVCGARTRWHRSEVVSAQCKSSMATRSGALSDSNERRATTAAPRPFESASELSRPKTPRRVRRCSGSSSSISASLGSTRFRSVDKGRCRDDSLHWSGRTLKSSACSIAHVKSVVFPTPGGPDKSRPPPLPRRVSASNSRSSLHSDPRPISTS